MVAAVQKSPSATAGLDTYGQLIRMLLPRAQSISIYGSDARTLWASDGQDDPDLQRLAADLMAGDAAASGDIDGTVRQYDGANAYAFRLRDPDGMPLAAVTLLARESNEEARPFSLVLGLLRPALECLQRDLGMQASIGAMSEDLHSRDRDLELLLDASVDKSKAGRGADELARLVQAAVDHLGCVMGALIIPERSIAIVRAQRDQPQGRAAEVVTRTHRHLMSWATLQRCTLTINKVSAAAKLPPYKILSVPVRHLSHRVIGFLALFADADAEDFRRRERRLAELLARKVTSILLTSYDAATGLLSRGAFEQQVDALIGSRKAAAADAIVYLDIDQLHVINENFGMHVGDETIVKVADVVRRRAPIGALAARISGDRFALFLPNTTPDAAAQAAEAIRASVAELTQKRPEGVLAVGISAGVAVLPGNSKQPLSHALAMAEIASKAAKDHGRDRVETFDHGDVSMVRRHSEVHIIAGLREAIAADRFRLYAQPILPLSIGPGEPRFEILIRLLTDAGELLPPSKFLPAAESYQLMPEIDRWVIERSLAELGAHAKLLQDRVARFAINLSGQSVTDPDMAGFIESHLTAAGIPADILCFELTETAAVTHLERAEAFMQRIRNLGCEFALDDFGTGASSLAYLKTLPVSVLKIDGSFVRDALVNPRSDSMVKAVAQLARAMGITTVAEFVETDELRIRMADLGVDYGQGFAIGKPVPLADVLQDLSLYELVATDATGRMAVEMPRLTG
ncbi:MAG TPA: bifunctional diguanylate cyclase/phosphodiesterase [Steroidobacteraceae bacterium]|nr:bifunctional diguanylate cyclase/phosphodiesterase [Steroidobacteraceae bacterium]